MLMATPKRFGLLSKEQRVIRRSPVSNFSGRAVLRPRTLLDVRNIEACRHKNASRVVFNLDMKFA
jgi:hypothetical protein